MANQSDLALNENNDETVNVTITTNQPTPGTVLNLTGASLEAFLKVSPSTSDTDPGTWKGVSPTDITITDAANGKASVVIPGSAVTASKGWWRLDVILSSKRKTAVYGTVTVKDL